MFGDDIKDVFLSNWTKYVTAILIYTERHQWSWRKALDRSGIHYVALSLACTLCSVLCGNWDVDQCMLRMTIVYVALSSGKDKLSMLNTNLWVHNIKKKSSDISCWFLFSRECSLQMSDPPIQLYRSSPLWRNQGKVTLQLLVSTSLQIIIYTWSIGKWRCNWGCENAPHT